MNIAFASPATAEAAFTMTVSFIGILIVMVIAGFHLSYRDNPTSMKLRTRFVIGAMVLIGVSTASYVANYGKFISADVTNENVKLHFAGSIYKDVNLPKNSIGSVAFGFPDRGLSTCNISFVDKIMNKQYQSAFTRNQQDTCKSLRLKIMQLLALPT
jgi:hypothetical protein